MNNTRDMKKVNRPEIIAIHYSIYPISFSILTLFAKPCITNRGCRADHFVSHPTLQITFLTGMHALRK